MVEKWRGTVNVVLYRVQFAGRLDDDLAAEMARLIVSEPRVQTAETQYSHLERALRSDQALTDLIPDAHSDQAFRDFLVRVLRYMDALRPWPEPPYRPLWVSEWQNFAQARPVARIEDDYVYVQERVHQIFSKPEGTEHKVLILRMASGADVAFFVARPSADTVDLLVRDPNVRPQEIVSELVECTRLAPEDFTLLDGSQNGND